MSLGNGPEPQTNADGYVRLVASPPKQINIISSDGAGRLPLANLDDQGFFKPPKAQYSEKYLAGYEQLDFPEQDGIFPGNINPDLIDPDDYHQDRPSFQVSTVVKIKMRATWGLGVFHNDFGLIALHFGLLLVKSQSPLFLSTVCLRRVNQWE